VWATRTAAFTLTDRSGALLLVRHERLGVVSWEPPGGHVECGETVEQAAARETAEGTGVAVEVGRLVATCVHEWAEREQRRVPLFFATQAVGLGRPRPHVLPQ
jgi:8-oxo-dGTP diphosphatase